MLSGTATGLLRYFQRPIPPWLINGRWVFVIAGFLMAASLVALLSRWVPLLFGMARRRAADGAEFPPLVQAGRDTESG